MTPEKLNRLWLIATGILILIILMSSILVWAGWDKGKIIYLSANIRENYMPGNVNVEGAVANPGRYDVMKDDTLDDLLSAAGGINQNADLSRITILVPTIGLSPQKININNAEIWLLQALPEIGEIRARAIVDYRSQNGPFNSIEEIKQVPGLSQSTFEKIRGLISISD